MAHFRKTILILGAGFAGLRAALTLHKKLSPQQANIVLVDEHDVHIYTPDLYEIATTFNKELTQECLTTLKDTVAIPIHKVLHGTTVEFLQDRAVRIDPKHNTVELKKRGAFPYDYLVLSLGSVVNYYNIPGLREFSLSLKTITDALAINCHLDFYFHNLWKTKAQKRVSIIVGGGGATGVEFASELPTNIDKLCEKYHYPRLKIEIHLIEGSAELTGQSGKVTSILMERLHALGVNVRMESLIQQVTTGSLTLQTKEKRQELSHDILIWTGGVKPNSLIAESFLKVAKNGALPVNPYLQNEGFPNVYAAGDNASFIDFDTGRPLPMLAQVAFDEGKVLGNNIAAEVLKKKKRAYAPHVKGVIIPAGGKYAVYKTSAKPNAIIFKGFLMWMLRRLVDLRYALSILPFWYAVRKWVHDTNIFIKNDAV